MLGSAFLHLQEQITVAFGTKRRKAEKQREADLQKQSDAAVAAWKPSPLEEAQQKRVTGFLSDWDSGKDVSEIDYLRPYYNLYNNAADDTPDMAGEGLLGNNMLSGANGQVAEGSRTLPGSSTTRRRPLTQTPQAHRFRFL
jgi:hypothetical protein